MQSIGKYKLTGSNKQLEKLSCLLKQLYRDQSAEELNNMWSQLLQILEENSDIDLEKPKNPPPFWDSSSAVLITYADGIYSSNKPSLIVLKELVDNHFGKLASTIHLLPFLCSTSDGGFAVSSYEKIESRFGSWDDLKKLSYNHNIMADLVLNHVSASHPWVHQFRTATDPGQKFILAPEINQDWSNVIRPRNTSLFTSIVTNEGHKNVWTTFGPDQIDINWREPQVLIEFLILIIRYIKNGISWIRLDAIGFIWKEESSTCLHMDQVHQIVKILRILLEYINSSGIIITETNVPEKENISYIQTADEAHLAYNFPLPPLLLESLLNNKADLINQWLCTWPSFPRNTGFLNFTASHDGIGLRALEGLMDSSRLHNLLIACEKRGGLISHRRMESGEDKPYELNISWWSAMTDGGVNPSRFQFERFILSQLFVMALKGVPAFYLQAIMASENDLDTFDKSGERRDLNREKFEQNTLYNVLQDPRSFASKNIRILKNAMEIRSGLIAFNPEQPMSCLSRFRSDVVVICRGNKEDRVWAVHNMTNSKLSFAFGDYIEIEIDDRCFFKDVLNENICLDNKVELKPYSVHWFIKTNERYG